MFNVKFVFLFVNTNIVIKEEALPFSIRVLRKRHAHLA